MQAHKLLVPLSSALLLLASCASAPSSAERNAEESLLLADRAFAHSVQQHRLEAWVAAFDEHGTQFGEGAPVSGHDAIREHMRAAFADPRFVLEWEPVEARVPENGKLGFVWGHWTLHEPKADGTSGESHGRYLDIWRRDASGAWKLVFDAGE